LIDVVPKFPWTFDWLHKLLLSDTYRPATVKQLRGNAKIKALLPKSNTELVARTLNN
jgi:hypothetical protein